MSATADGRISFGQHPPNTSESTVVQSQNRQGWEDRMREGLEAINRVMRELSRKNEVLTMQLYTAKMLEFTQKNAALTMQLHWERRRNRRALASAKKESSRASTSGQEARPQDHMRQRLDHLSGLVEKLKKVQNEKKKKSTLFNSPFCATIARGKIPSKFKLPTLSTYDNLSDPVVHVKTYLQAMTQWVHDDMVLCRFFAGSLFGPALNWFYHLPPTRIQNFAELTDAFVHRFAHLWV